MAGDKGDRFSVLLDSIPGAWDRAQKGLADAQAGRVISLDELELDRVVATTMIQDARPGAGTNEEGER